MLNKTINYYDINAKEFVEGTLNVDFKTTQDKFINKLPAKGYILDFVCPPVKTFVKSIISSLRLD